MVAVELVVASIEPIMNGVAGRTNLRELLNSRATHRSVPLRIMLAALK